MGEANYQLLAKVCLLYLICAICCFLFDIVIYCQALFVVMMILMFTLLVNMLIAMMGNTYQAVADTRKEWTRQVCHCIELMEDQQIHVVFIRFYISTVGTDCSDHGKDSGMERSVQVPRAVHVPRWQLERLLCLHN